jgi:nucleoid DNA-binding protein
MAPKKVTPVTPASSAPATKRPRKAAAPKAAPADDGPKKRNMTAVSTDFVSAVQSSLPEDLVAKLKVKEIKEVCETFVKVLVDKVKAGETVSFTNNMTFKRQVRSKRVYKNLKTGDPIEKPPHYVMSMQIKPALKRVFDEVKVVEETKKTAKKA